MPIGLMNLLRSSVPMARSFFGLAAKPALKRKEAVNAALNKTPLFRTRAAKPVGGTGTTYGNALAPSMGRANRALYGPAKTPLRGLGRGLGYGLVGSIAGDYAVRKAKGLFNDEEEQQDEQSGVIPSRMQYPTRDELGSQADIESRVEFEQRKQAKFNKQMKQLMVNYGIVNLVNPASAKEMLKLGTAILGQDIEAMGNQRQAEIFDSIFGGGNVPATAMEAYERVMAAGGTAADAKEISGIVESATPAASTRAPSVVEIKLQIGAQLKQLLAAGKDEDARKLYLQAIYAGIINPPTGETGIQMSPEQAAEAFLRSAKAGGSDNIDSDMHNLVKID